MKAALKKIQNTDLSKLSVEELSASIDASLEKMFKNETQQLKLLKLLEAVPGGLTKDQKRVKSRILEARRLGLKSHTQLN